MRQPSRTRAAQGAGSKGPASRIRSLHRSDCGHLAQLTLEVKDGTDREVPDYPGIARLYAEAVASKRLPTNRLLVLAAQRYLDMLEMAEVPGNDFYYSPLHVIDYCEFGERLCHFESGMWEVNQVGPDGAPLKNIILEPFEIWIESAIQGFRNRLNGTRLVTTALELIPRKNAKSLRATRAALFDLCCSGGMAPEIPVAAATEKQADDTLFGDILKMVNADLELCAHFGIKATKDEITCGDGRIFKLSSMGERQDGLNPSLALFEEGHAGAASVYKVVDSAFGARPNALRRMITTAGYRSEGPAHELMNQVIRVLEGLDVDYTLFGAIFTLDIEDYQDKESHAIVWDTLLSDEDLIWKCNPMMGVGLNTKDVIGKVKEAHRARPDKRGEVARTRFNIWTGAGTTLIEPAAWAACKRNTALEDFIGMKCWIGVDLAAVLDMCAIALLFELEDGTLALFVKYYLPQQSPTALDPELIDIFARWEDGEYLVMTEGQLADHDMVGDDIELFCEMFDVQVIATDPYQAHNTSKRLWDGQKPVVMYPNNAKTMTAPTDDFLGRIATKTLIHDGNPVLAWNAQNVCGERKGNGSIVPRKDKPDSKRKIDGFVAGLMANGCRMQPEEAKPAGEVEKAVVDPYLIRGIVGFEETNHG